VAQLFSLGGYTFMKNTLLILLSAFLFCGCSKKQAIPTHQATDRIEAGKDIVLGASVVHVIKRSGNSIEGIQIVTKYAGGKVKTLSADTGRLLQGSDPNTLTIILNKAECQTKDQSGTTTNTIQNMQMVFYLHDAA
jgi:PBP1b-binding outer membrane lipoprotein LpoB